MPVQTEWLVDKQIIHINAIGDISVEDIKVLSEKIIASINISDRPLVHVIISEENMDSMPKSIQAMSEVTKFFRHERLGWFLIYGNTERDRIAIFVATVVTGMTKIRHRRFTTFEESLEFLISVDTTLPSVQEIIQ